MERAHTGPASETSAGSKADVGGGASFHGEVIGHGCL